MYGGEGDDAGDIGGGGGGRGSAASIACAPARPELSHTQLAQKLILENPRCQGEVTTADARIWVRNKMMHRKVADVAKVISEAVHGLGEAGVLELIQDSAPRPVEPPTGARRVRHRGRPIVTFVKNPWCAIQASEAARHIVAFLGVVEDHFCS